MGAAKAAMMEQEDWLSRFEGLEAVIDFTCPECNKDVSIEVSMSDYPDLQLCCIKCDKLLDAEWMDDGDIGISLLKHPDTEIEVNSPSRSFLDDHGVWDDSAHWDDFWNQGESPPENTFDVFSKAQYELFEYIDQIATQDGAHTRNRMAFIHSFSIFEAYLSDTYLNLVHQNEKTENLFLVNSFNKKMHKGEKISYDDLIANRGCSVDDILANKITKQIKRVSFHNFNIVNKLYQVYKIECFDETPQRDVLFKAVSHRHNCVHRNGYDSDGEQLNIFTIDYLRNILEAMKQVASRIEKQVLSLSNDSFE